jgi:hypothetical protein
LRARKALLTSSYRSIPPARVIPNPRVFGGVRDLLVAFLRVMSPAEPLLRHLIETTALRLTLTNIIEMV